MNKKAEETKLTLKQDGVYLMLLMFFSPFDI